MTTDNQHIPSGYKPSPLGIIPEDWEVMRLGDLCQDIFSGRNKSRLNSGSFPVYGSTGIIGLTDCYQYEGNKILVARVGAHAGLVSRVSGKYDVSDNTIIVENKQNYLTDFAYYQLVFMNLNKLVFGSGQPLITSGMLKRLYVTCPKVTEQKRICDLLSLWDTAIAKQTALIEKLTLRKRGLMQQLLTGKKRLKGFDGEWEEVKLGEVCDLTKGEQVNSETLTETGLFPVINGGIAPSGYKDDYNTEANTITISEGGNSCGFVNMIKTKFWSGGHCYTISNIINFDLNYLYYSLKFAEPHIMNLRVGSGLPNIQLGPLQKFTLLMPQLEEQKAISAFLEQADKEIELANKKISYMQQQKKGLMQVLLTGKKRINK